MTDEQSETDDPAGVPETVATAAADRPAFERAGDGYRVTTTAFDARVTATPVGERAIGFAVTVEVPTLSSAVDGEVGSAVAEGWRDTFERRLAEAGTATRARVDLKTFEVESDGDTVTVVYGFEFSNAARGLDVAKTFVEYVEGTYVEGVVPGYDYLPPVSDLLAAASQGDGERGGTPL
jgi:3',5'-cyclic AMP phosphodiesterase CpdA